MLGDMHSFPSSYKIKLLQLSWQISIVLLDWSYGWTHCFPIVKYPVWICLNPSSAPPDLGNPCFLPGFQNSALNFNPIIWAFWEMFRPKLMESHFNIFLQLHNCYNADFWARHVTSSMLLSKNWAKVNQYRTAKSHWESHNPLVAGSNPTGFTTLFNLLLIPSISMTFQMSKYRQSQLGRYLD